MLVLVLVGVFFVVMKCSNWKVAMLVLVLAFGFMVMSMPDLENGTVVSGSYSSMYQPVE